MILSKYVEVILGTFTIKYYENKGYFIPKIINSDNKAVVKRGTKIIVRVSDLPKESTTKILRKCDKCGKELEGQFQWLEGKTARITCIDCATKELSQKLLMPPAIDEVKQINAFYRVYNYKTIDELN